MSRSPTDPFPAPEPGVDAVVRAALDAEAGRTDPRPVWDRVRARLDAETPRPVAAGPAGRWWRLPAAGLAAAGLAAAVLLAVSFVPPEKQAAASPAEVVRAARDAYERGPDRRYTQTITVTHPDADPVIDGGRRAVVWVRGDAFVAEPGWGGTGAWGRDPEGRVWFAPTRAAALRYTPGELPPAVREAVQIRSLELDALLGGVLADFDLDWAVPPAAGGPRAVAATRRGPAGPFQVASAEVVVEPDTQVIRSLAVRRALPAGGAATVGFELAPVPPPLPVLYTAEGHLNPAAPVYDADTPVRRVVLRKHFGRFFRGKI